VKESNRGLYSVYIAATAVLMDLTAVNIALPTISRYFGITLATASLILLVSMLTSSAFALIAGKIIETSNAGKLLLVGFAVFGTANIAAFFTTNFTVLLVIRFISGFAESVIYVIGPALIRKCLPPNKQQGAHGIWMACTGIGISMGPVIGSILIAGFGWNYVFLINVFLSLAGFAFAISLNKNFRAPNRKMVRFDIKGAVYSFLFIGFLVFGLNTLGRQTANIWAGLIALMLSVFFLLLFIVREKNTAFPLLELRLFMIRNFTLSNIGFFLFFLVNVGSRFLRPFYFEAGRGFETRVSGILMMISPLIMVILSPLTKYITKWILPRNICIIAGFLLMVSMLMFTSWGPETSLLYLIISMLVLGVAMGLYYPTNAFIGMNSVKENQNGMASATISTSKSMGKLMGILVFSFVFELFFPYKMTEAIFIKDQNELFFAIRITFVSGVVISFISLLFSFWLLKSSTSSSGKNLVVGEYNTFTLNGTLNDGSAFTGSEDILVVNNIPKKKK